MKIQQQTVLITGGSSGIGFEISRHFAKAGYNILWVSKPEKELQEAKQKLEAEIAGVMIHTLAKDLSKSQAPKEVHRWASQIAPIDVLINNAGFGTYGYLQNITVEKEIDMISLNVLAVYKLTRLFLDDMLRQNAGTIINISSNSSFQPVPRMNTYASTKAFVRHFSRGLQEELKIQQSKVRVMTVCPAAINDTPFRKHGELDKVKTFSGLAYTTAKEVAVDVWKGFKNEKTFVVTGWKMRVLYSFIHLIPFQLQQFLVRKETELSD